MNRKSTRHDRRSIRKFRKGGEVDSPLPDLYHWSLALALIILIRILPLERLLGPRTISDEVIRTPAIETAISAASLLKLLSIWPWAKLLRLLRRHWRSISSLLLGCRKTNLPGGAFRCGTLSCTLGTTRYLGD
jgi:hypothetical protein